MLGAGPVGPDPPLIFDPGPCGVGAVAGLKPPGSDVRSGTHDFLELECRKK